MKVMHATLVSAPGVRTPHPNPRRVRISRIAILAAGMICFLGLWVTWPLSAQTMDGGKPVRLFEGAARSGLGAVASSPAPGWPDAPRVVREQAIQAETSVVRQVFGRELPFTRGAGPASAGSGSLRSSRREATLPSIALPLFPDTVFVMQPERVTDFEGSPGAFAPAQGMRGRTIVGPLTSGGEGTAILSEYGGAISASLRLSNGEFYEWEMFPGEEGTAVGTVRQMEGTARWPGSDEVVIPDEDEEEGSGRSTANIPPSSALHQTSLLEQSGALFSEGEQVITVAAYYTRRVVEARGGPAGLMAWLRRVEAESNEALRNSNLNLEYRFVSAILVDHDDSSSEMSYSATLRSLRHIYDAGAQPRARLATLFVAPPLPVSSSFTVGIAYLRIPEENPQRHSVNHHLYAGGLSLTFAHEAGHNFGCVHDVDNGGENGGLYGDSRGYQQRNQEPKFFTVMAYSCSGCRAAPYYSEPSVLYETIPAGTQSTRCAATLAREAVDLSWQGAPPPAGCAIELYPSELRLSAVAQDVQVEVRTQQQGCAWRAESNAGAPFVEDLDASQTRTGSGWLRLRIPANNASSRRMEQWDVRGVSLRLTQNPPGEPVFSANLPVLHFQASLRPDSVQERCLFVNSAPGPSVLEVRTAGLPRWLNFDRDRVDVPGYLCARVDAGGLSAGDYRAAPLLTTGGEAPTDLVLSVELQVTNAVLPVLYSPRAISFRTFPSQPITAIQKLEIAGLADLVLSPLSGPPSWLKVQPERNPDGYRVDVWADATGLMPGVHTARLLIGCPGDACATRVVPVHLSVEGIPAGGPRIVSGGVVNAAGFSPGLSVGSWMSVFGVDLSATTRNWAGADFLGDLLPTALDGVRVLVDGLPGAISFVSPNQINFQVPEVERTGWVPVEVVTPAGRDTHWAYVESLNPGIFLLNGVDVAALHEDATPAAMEGSLGPNAPTRAARPGDLLALYGTGFGATSPKVFAGRLYQGAARIPFSNPVRVTVGGQEAQILFAGQSAAGLNQINLRVPDLPPGSHPVRVTVGATPASWHGSLRVE